MIKIKEVKAREILDSRGNPTVEATVVLSNGIKAKAAAPSSDYISGYSAVEVRDNDKSRYGGKGVLQAVANIEAEIAGVLKNINVLNQEKIDDLMIKLDGTSDKNRIGTNAMFPVSLAVARAAAKSKNFQLFEYISKTYKFNKKKYNIPVPIFNIFNGGKYSDTNLDFQEFMIDRKSVV